MPELPEVETIRRDLEPVVDRRIRTVTVHDEKLTEESPELPDQVAGARISKLDRRGKYLLVHLDRGLLLFSLRMTGNLTFEPPADDTDRVDFELGDRTLYFTTVRRFSRVHFHDTTDYGAVPKLRKLGLDPMNGSFTPDALKKSFRNRTAPVKTLLMNQEVVAGIGNIYANEICFEAGVRPDRGVDRLDYDMLKRVVEVTPGVLEKAIASRGSSISDYSRPDGDEGAFQDEFKVYGRRDESCVKCGTELEIIELSGRSTFFCPECQK